MYKWYTFVRPEDRFHGEIVCQTPPPTASFLPTDEARVDLSVDGPVIWRGGYCSDKLNTTNNLYLDTECGINRVAIRSTTPPGKITVTAPRNDLQAATLAMAWKGKCRKP